MEINEAEYENDILQYIHSESRLEENLLSSFTRSMVDSAKHNTNYVYVNGGPYMPKYKATSKTAIAHKILFDSANRTAKLFAKGLHPNIFENEFVVASCLKFIKRAVKNRKDKETPVLELIAKEEEFRLYNCLEDLVLYKEIRKYEKEAGEENVFSIKRLEPTVKIPTSFNVSINENTDSVLELDVCKTDERKKPPSSINTFSVFDGKTFRYRKDVSTSHKAYINFGTPDVAGKFSEWYEELSELAVVY